LATVLATRSKVKIGFGALEKSRAPRLSPTVKQPANVGGRWDRQVYECRSVATPTTRRPALFLGETAHYGFDDIAERLMPLQPLAPLDDELQDLRWADVDLLDGVLRVRASKTEEGVRAIALMAKAGHASVGTTLERRLLGERPEV